MSKYTERVINNLQIKNQRLESDKKRLEIKVEELETELYKARLKMSGVAAAAGAAGREGIDCVVEQAAKDRQILEARIKELEVYIKEREVFFPPMGISQPVLPVGEGDKQIKQREQEGERWVTIPKNKVRMVCLTLAIRELEEHIGDPIIFTVAKEYGLYPGTTDEILDEIGSRLKPLVKRSPLPENLHARTIPGVTGEQMVDAMTWISDWRFNEDHQQNSHVDYFERRKEVYDKLLMSSVDTTKIENFLARNNWSQTVDDSFSDMAKYGRGSGVEKPRKRNRKGTKHGLNYIQTSLRRISS